MWCQIWQRPTIHQELREYGRTNTRFGLTKLSSVPYWHCRRRRGELRCCFRRHFRPNISSTIVLRPIRQKIEIKRKVGMRVVFPVFFLSTWPFFRINIRITQWFLSPGSWVGFRWIWKVANQVTQVALNSRQERNIVHTVSLWVSLGRKGVADL